MTLQEQMQMARNRALAALDNSAEYQLREAQTDLLEYYADNMQSATATNNVRTASGKLRALKNKTDKVYVLYGNLIRALIPKKKGNISEFAKQGQKLYAKIGIDTAVIPYAAVHEYGGGNNIPARPYFFPAIKKYVEQGFDARLRKIVEDSIKAWG